MAYLTGDPDVDAAFDAFWSDATGVRTLRFLQQGLYGPSLDGKGTWAMVSPGGSSPTRFAAFISQAPGFVAYYIVDAGNHVVASISLFQDQAGAEESNRMAADWVKENIAAFGGDPDNVTIFGFSSGGVSVHSLMTILAAKGLFHKVISASCRSCSRTRTRPSTRA